MVGNGYEKVSDQPRLVMGFRDNQFDIIAGPTDLVIEIRNYDHHEEPDDPKLLTDINGSTFTAYIYRADKEVETVDD
jgi:hypothetical protein